MLELHFASMSRAVRILWLLEELELPDETTYLKAHVARLEARPAFQKADSVGK